MQRSVYLARLIGPPFIVAGIGMLFNGAVYRALAEQFIASPALIYLSGVIVLPVGIALVLAHNLWVKDWRVIITVFGWLAIVGGTIRMIAPQAAQLVGGGLFDNAYVLPIAGAVIAALGCILSYCGYADLDADGTAAAPASTKTTAPGKPRSAARKRRGK
ncbi:MAG: hypothetical protein AB7O50_03570 [Pseudolabrys sp.]